MAELKAKCHLIREMFKDILNLEKYYLNLIIKFNEKWSKKQQHPNHSTISNISELHNKSNETKFPMLSEAMSEILSYYQEKKNNLDSLLNSFNKNLFKIKIYKTTDIKETYQNLMQNEITLKKNINLLNELKAQYHTNIIETEKIIIKNEKNKNNKDYDMDKFLKIQNDQIQKTKNLEKSYKDQVKLINSLINLGKNNEKKFNELFEISKIKEYFIYQNFLEKYKNTEENNLTFIEKILYSINKYIDKMSHKYNNINEMNIFKNSKNNSPNTTYTIVTETESVYSGISNYNCYDNYNNNDNELTKQKTMGEDKLKSCRVMFRINSNSFDEGNDKVKENPKKKVGFNKRCYCSDKKLQLNKTKTQEFEKNYTQEFEKNPPYVSKKTEKTPKVTEHESNSDFNSISNDEDCQKDENHDDSINKILDNNNLNINININSNKNNSKNNINPINDNNLNEKNEENKEYYFFEKYTPSIAEKGFIEPDDEVSTNTLAIMAKNFDLNLDSKIDIKSIEKDAEFDRILNKILNAISTLSSTTLKLSKKEINILKDLLLELKYRNKFLDCLNQRRGNMKLFNNPNIFELMCNLIKHILIYIDYTNVEEYRNIQYAILLAQSFYLEDSLGNKIYMDDNIDIKELVLNDSDFWVDYIHADIDDELKKVDNNKDQIPFFRIIGYISNLVTFLQTEEKIEKTISSLVKIYNMSDEQKTKILEQVKLEFKSVNKKMEKFIYE